MKIHVGSKNPTKLQAVKNLLNNHAIFGISEIIAIDPQVEEFGHPKTLDETIAGAKKRAKSVFDGSELSVGIESGLFEVKDAKTGYMETTICALYDGSTFHIGMGPSFEWPKEMIKLILSGKDGSQAFKALGLTSHDKIGTSHGGIHVLTHAKVNRTELNELALQMALIHIENRKLYI
jgi:inosine/xanthosine triphosphatase